MYIKKSYLVTYIYIFKYKYKNMCIYIYKSPAFNLLFGSVRICYKGIKNIGPYKRAKNARNTLFIVFFCKKNCVDRQCFLAQDPPQASYKFGFKNYISFNKN